PKKSPEKERPNRLIDQKLTDAAQRDHGDDFTIDKRDSKLSSPVEPKKSPEKERPDRLIDPKLTDAAQRDHGDDFSIDKLDSKISSPVEPKTCTEEAHPELLLDPKITDTLQPDDSDILKTKPLDKLDSKLSSPVEPKKSPEKEHLDTLIDVKLTDAAQTDPGADFTLGKLDSKLSSPVELKKSPKKQVPDMLIDLKMTDVLPPDHSVFFKPTSIDTLDSKLSSPEGLEKCPEKEHPDMLLHPKLADTIQPDPLDILKTKPLDKFDSKLSSQVGLKKSPEKEHLDKLADVKLTGGLPPDHADVLKSKAFNKLYIKLSSPIDPKKSLEKEPPEKLLNLELIEALQTDHATVFGPTSTKPLHKLDSKAPLPAEFVKTTGKNQLDEVLGPNVMNVLPTDYSDHLKTKPINNLESRLSSPVELEESIEKECLRECLLPELNKSKDHSRTKSKPHIGKNIDKIILKDSGAIAYFVGLEQTVDRKELFKRPQTLSPQIESKYSEIILGADKKPTNLKTIASNKTSRKLPVKRSQDSSRTTAVEKPPTVSEVENKKTFRKTVPKQDERNATKLVALNNQIRLERISRTKTQPTTKSAKTDSTFIRTKPRPKTEITSLPQNQTLRTFSPPSTHPKPDYSGVTSIYAHLRKSQKKSASIKSKDSTTVSRSSTPNEESQSKRTRTPTPSKMYNYMRPTMAHNLRYGVSKTSEDEISVEEKPPRSPVPTKRSDLEKFAPKRKNLTKLRSNISGSKTSLSKSLHQVQDKDTTTLKTLEVKPKKKVFGPAKSVSEKRSQVQHLKEHKLQRTEQSVYDRRLQQKRQNSERAEKMASKKANKDEKVKIDEMTNTKKKNPLISSKVSIGRASETSLIQAQKRDKVQEIKKFESKSKSQDKYSATKKFIDNEKLSDDIKVQKKLKNTINQSNATSSTSSSVRKSKSKTTARSAASKKIEKEIANQKLTEKKPLTTTTTRISTIKLYREPVLTTLVSTVIIDDGDSENTTRSTRSNDSTKSSSSTGSKKIITSEVFTKTFGPDKPFEVIYRQPEVDYMSMMRPQSVEQRCVNEFDVSFIDTTDSSLSDSVALPIFGSDQDRLHAASPGSPKPTRSPLALIEETVRKQQMDGFSLDPTLQRQFEAGGMISAIESPTSELILKPQETLDEYLPESHSETAKQESENYAITCDDINGLEVIKSPTIESMSVASEQICMSEGSDERDADETDIIIKTRTRRIDHKFQKLSGGHEQDIDVGAAQFDEQFGAIVQDDEISNLQGEFSKLSWDDSISPTTNTLGDIGQNTPDNDIQDIAPEIGGDLIKSTVITPVPPSATISSSSTDIIGSSIQDTPTPRPRLIKRTSPSAEDIKKFVEIETADGGSIPTCISEIPVPKPRSQMKPTESCKNLAALQIDSDSPTDVGLTKRNATETVMERTTSPDDSVKKSEIFESSGSKTSFYIGESSQNIIIKTTSPKSLLDLDDNAKSVLNEIPQKNLGDINEEGKDSIEFKSADPDYMSKITRQSSETRNDLLEQDVIVSSDKKFEPTESDLTIKDAKDEDEEKEKIVLEEIAPQNVIDSQLENGLNKEIFEPKGVELEKRCELELPLEKDDWEINAKEIPPPSKNKIVYSPQQPSEKIVKPPFTEDIVTQTLDEVQESIEAAKRGLKSVLKDAKLIKESPSEFEFRTLAQSLTTTKQPHLEDGNLSLMESEDISSFIGIPDKVSNVVDNLNKKAVAAHYTESITDEKKLESGDEYASLGFVSTGTYDSDPQISREDYASLGFVSTETAEDFSSMEDYYQENIAKAHETIEPEEKKETEELHRASDDRPLYNEKSTDPEEENFKKMVQQQYQKKLAELQKAQIGDSDYDDHKTPDSPDSFEMVDKPDISDEFVIIEEVAKEANEDEMGGKSIRIKPAKYEYQHDEEVEKIIIKSAPADPKLGSQILRDDLNFEFEESPPTASSGGAGSEPQEDVDPGTDAALGSRRWVEMQLVDNQLRYPYELTGGVLEDIKEEDAEFEVGSSRISSFKDSFSSTPDYDVLAARRHYSRGDHDDISMSSLQEFESLEQAISLENRNRTHQGSTDSSNGSFTRRYTIRHGNASGAAHGDDISISSLKEFEGLENACIEAHLIEIKAKEEAALLSRSDESNKSNGSERDPAEVNNAAISKAIGNLTQTGVINDSKLDIGILLKQKLEECEKKTADFVQSTEVTSEHREIETDSTSIKQHSTEEKEHTVNISPTTVTAAADSDITSSRIVSTTTTTTILGSSNLPLAAETLARDQMTKDTSMDSLNLSAVDQTTSSAGTTATYQTSAGNSQMSGSVTSCASSTLMEDSAVTTTSSWSSEEKTNLPIKPTKHRREPAIITK
uniref:Uncharacterized protein n=1 Tax=Glossina austeni TaxID=7395 RepID=A0A1A9UJL2_GLOAU